MTVLMQTAALSVEMLEEAVHIGMRTDRPERGKKAAGEGRVSRAACWGVKDALSGSCGYGCTIPLSFTAVDSKQCQLYHNHWPFTLLYLDAED